MNKENSGVARISLRLSCELKARVRKQADKEYRSIAKLVLLALEQYLERSEKPE